MHIKISSTYITLQNRAKIDQKNDTKMPKTSIFDFFAKIRNFKCSNDILFIYHTYFQAKYDFYINLGILDYSRLFPRYDKFGQNRPQMAENCQKTSIVDGLGLKFEIYCAEIIFTIY